ncbi:cytochrome P450 [Marasmius fiardii PR-910]|nr:cytochrome P450 [Marasmius fiardii PR-910]
MALPFVNPLSYTHLSALPLITVVFCAAGTAYFALLRYIFRGPLDISDIPGPVDSASWLYGNLPELLLSQPYGTFESKWQEQYGPVYHLKGCFSVHPTALRYILNDAQLFDISPNRRFMRAVMAGQECVPALPTGEEVHRRIKNAFSATFASTRLQPYAPIIRVIARKAADKLTQQCSEKSGQSGTVNIYHLLQHLTTDVIVGVGYKFNAVETDGGDEVAQSHQHVLMLRGKRSKGAILAESVIPCLPHTILKPMLQLPLPSSRKLRNFLQMLGFGTCTVPTSCAPHQPQIANNLQKRERLSFNEIIQQAPALLAAGQDTTATALAWGLLELAKRPTWQDQVRKEIIEAQRSDLGLDKLEYLNAHIKETLRFHTNGPLTERMAYKDAVLPLSRPVTTISGRVITKLPIRKAR